MKIASNHENQSTGPAKERTMDLANNATGRSVGAAYKTNSKAQDRCAALAKAGKLKTLK